MTLRSADRPRFRRVVQYLPSALGPRHLKRLIRPQPELMFPLGQDNRPEIFFRNEGVPHVDQQRRARPISRSHLPIALSISKAALYCIFIHGSHDGRRYRILRGASNAAVLRADRQAATQRPKFHMFSLGTTAWDEEVGGAYYVPPPPHEQR